MTRMLWTPASVFLRKVLSLTNDENDLITEVLNQKLLLSARLPFPTVFFIRWRDLFT